MKRLEIPSTETDTGEPEVRVVDRSKDLRRLADGVAVYELTLRQLGLLGVQSDYDPDEVKAAGKRIRERVELPGQDGEVETMKDYAVTLSTEQAVIVHQAAQFMVMRAAEQVASHEALLYEGASGGPLHPYSWHGRPYDIWTHFAEALEPPTAPGLPSEATN